MKLLGTALFCFVALMCKGQLNLMNRPYTGTFALQVNELAKGFFVAAPNQSTETKNWSTVENYAFGKDRGNLTMINDLKALHPVFRDKIERLIIACEAKGIRLAVVETYRTHAKQNEYKSMGKKFTRSGGGSSKHQYGLAVDLVPIVRDTAQWHNDQLWKKIGTIGEQLGLRWGGRWRNPYDPGHFEWTGGLTSTHLAHGMMPKIPNAEKHYPCLESEMDLLKEEWKTWEANQAVMAREKNNPVAFNK